jgi:hypothetical protein
MDIASSAFPHGGVHAKGAALAPLASIHVSWVAELRQVCRAVEVTRE